MKQIFLKPVEFMDQNENEMFEELTEFMCNEILKKYPKNSGNNYPKVINEGHGGNIAVLRGTLSIHENDILSLPPSCRVGLFKKPGDYEIIARFNYVDIKVGPIESTRVSIKIKGPNNQVMDLLLAAYPNIPKVSGFFFRDATDIQFLGSLPKSLLSPSGLKQMFRIVLNNINNNNKQFAKEMRNTGSFGHYFTSATPYKLGPACIQWQLEPQQAHDMNVAKNDQKSRTEIYIDSAKEYCMSDETIRFDLCVKFATTNGTNGPIRSVEQNDINWNNEKCPTFKVGRIYFDPNQWEDRINEFGNPSEWSHLFSFNIGNTLAEHSPLGQNNRFRMRLYKDHTKTRLEHFHDLNQASVQNPFLNKD